jgi:hypothetical protein
LSVSAEKNWIEIENSTNKNKIDFLNADKIKDFEQIEDPLWLSGQVVKMRK